MRNCLTHSCKNKTLTIQNTKKKNRVRLAPNLPRKTPEKTSHSGASQNGQNPDGKSQSYNLEKLSLKKAGKKFPPFRKSCKKLDQLNRPTAISKFGCVK